MTPRHVNPKAPNFVFDDSLPSSIDRAILFRPRDMIALLFYRLCHQALPVLPTQNSFTLLDDGVYGGTCSPLDQSIGSLLQFLAQGAQLSHGLGDVMVEGETLRLKKIRIVRNNHGSFLAVYGLGDPETFRLF